MNIVVRASWCARFVVWAAFLAALPSPATAQSPEQPPDLDVALQSLHDEAKLARGNRDFSRVEALRIKRLSTLQAAAPAEGNEPAAAKKPAASPWVAGAKAIADADSLIQRMRYEQACKVLAKAWEPFEQPARGTAVFGDIAMKLFEATQAALAVYPEFNAVDAGRLRKAVQLAADADPCAVEALAVDAFLTTPDPDEAFERAEVRPSLRARNQRLLGISYDAARDIQPLPWHAPTEYLKAKGISFVLSDLGFYERFLDPRRTLRGRNSHGEPVSVVMGGSLLLSASDSDGSKRQFVAEYDPKGRRWLRLRPRILRVEPPSYRPQSWQIDEDSLNADIRAAVQISEAERQRKTRNRIMVSADGLKAATKAKAHIRKILGWMEDPPKGQKAPTFEEAIEMIAAGYVNYARRYPEEHDQAEKAYNMVIEAGKQWMQFREVSDVLLTSADGGNTAVDASAAAKSLAGFLSLLDESDSEDAEPATEEAAPVEAALLGGRELRSKLSQQKEQYEMLALFQLMDSIQRPAIEAIVARIPAPAPGATPQQEDEDQSPTAKLARALKSFDTIRAKATREQAAPNGNGPPTKKFSITLNTLQETIDSLRDMVAALRQIGGESERASFLDRFARTLEQVAQPIILEAELVRFCNDANLRQQWKVGRMTWRVYELPADVPHDQLANIVNYCPRVCFVLDDFAKLLESDARDEEDETDEGNPTPKAARLPLRPGCTTIARNRLVENRNGSLTLRMPRAIADPYTALLLDIEEDDGKPFTSAGQQLRLDDEGTPVTMALATGPGVTPAIVVQFAGADGHVPLGAEADAFQDNRFMKDRRGNTIVRDNSTEPSPTKANFYRMTSESGGALTERSVNYSIQDWLDLDRNIVNSFLPDLMMHAPSLPAWRLYRNEYSRPAPTADWKWTFARRAFSLVPEPAAASPTPGQP
jgi:hypothetical protein